MPKNHNSWLSKLAVVLAAVLLLSGLPTATFSQDRNGNAGAQDGWGGSVIVKQASPRPRSGLGTAKPVAPEVSSKPAATAARPATLSVTGTAMAGDKAITRIGFDLDSTTMVDVRSLSSPPRVIIDLPETTFRLPKEAGKVGRGLIKGFRFGLIEAGKSRIVLDTAGPVKVDFFEVQGPLVPGVWRLVVDLVPTTEAALAASELAAAVKALKPGIEDPELLKPRDLSRRPVIVVDPGHGGIDSGASGSRRLEKDVVLEVGRALRRALVATRRYEVAMTRAADVFISLDKRVEISRRLQSDLFISIHADSLPSREFAQTVRGATIYTLSEKASDSLAARMAENENAVDLLAGLPYNSSGDNTVRTILIDLMRRESATYSAGFRRALVSRLHPRKMLAREPMRSGPFKVLRQAASPAVLIELGYMSNARDEQLMSTREWQRDVSSAIVRAVDDHFRDRQARAR